MKKQENRSGRHRRLLFLWVLLPVIMTTAITVTSVSILSSQIRTNREQSVAGAAKLAANAVNPELVDGWLKNGKDAEYA